MMLMLAGTALSLVGCYCVVGWLYEQLRTPVQLLANALKHVAVGKPLPEKYGQWAVITGASDGIGKGYVQYLASRGMSIALVARDESKLNRVAHEITKKYGVRTKVLVADFTGGDEAYERLERELLPLDVGILVNNVGLGYERGMCVHELSKGALRNLMKVNMEPMTLLCHAFVPAMKQRGRGLIVNVSSISAVAPTPFVAVYGAAKAYVRSFSMALREELRPYQLDVQTVLPGFVRTNMTRAIECEFKDGRLASQLVPVDNFMRYAGFTIGKTDQTCGYWAHGLQLAGLSVVTERVRILIMKVLYNSLRKTDAI